MVNGIDRSATRRQGGVPACSRRDFLLSLAGAAGSVSLAGCTDVLTGLVAPAANAFDRSGASPRHSPIEHVIVVMMENRSFDHLLGWHPQADGRQAGLVYRDSGGNPQPSFALAPDFQGCELTDPNHSFDGGREEYNAGACDGWLRAGNDRFAIGYYRQQDLPFLGQAARDWTTCDRYFSAILGPTFPNRIYQHAGQTDRLSNLLVPSTLPTIWDRLLEAGLRGRYYYSDLPFLALWGDRYQTGPQAIAALLPQFFADCAAGTLPEVAFVDPFFIGNEEGTSGDDHPHGDIRAGETLLNTIYDAVTSSPNWSSAVLIVTFDEWGGFFDHVPPPAGPITDAERALGYNDGLRGFRVPVVVISPFARRTVSHERFDHTSILRLIEWRWGLAPLSVRDATARNLAAALGGNEGLYDRTRRPPPRYKVPNLVAGAACPVTPVGPVSRAGLAPPARSHWYGLRELARDYGWRV